MPSQCVRRRLIAAGVPTELNVVPGAFHGFDGLEQAPIVQQFNAALVSALRRALYPDRLTETGAATRASAYG